MHIEINSEKANNASMRLLDLSRTVRRSRECVEDARRQLRQLSDLDESTCPTPCGRSQRSTD